MKLSAFMLAFIVSTAIHVGALTSNLLHVNAESLPDVRDRTVKLHIVAPSVRESPVEITEQSPPVQSEVRETIQPERPVVPAPDIPELKSPEVVLTEMPTAVRLPVYREQPGPPDPPPVAETVSVEEFPEERTDRRPVFSQGSDYEADACGDCAALLASLPSLVPIEPGVSGSGNGKTSAAIITLPSKPKYPRYSRLHKEEGTTVLSVEILPDGKLGNVEVVQSSGYRRLDRAALMGMQTAELVAAVKDGRKVASVKRISIKFDLEDWGE